jgi:hypothetical protein
MYGNSGYDDLGKNTGDRAFKDTPEMSFDPSVNFDYDDPEEDNGVVKTGSGSPVAVSMGLRRSGLVLDGVELANVGLPCYAISPDILLTHT